MNVVELVRNATTGSIANGTDVPIVTRYGTVYATAMSGTMIRVVHKAPIRCRGTDLRIEIHLYPQADGGGLWGTWGVKNREGVEQVYMRRDGDGLNKVPPKTFFDVKTEISRKVGEWAVNHERVLAEAEVRFRHEASAKALATIAATEEALSRALDAHNEALSAEIAALKVLEARGPL